MVWLVKVANWSGCMILLTPVWTVGIILIPYPTGKEGKNCPVFQAPVTPKCALINCSSFIPSLVHLFHHSVSPILSHFPYMFCFVPHVLSYLLFHLSSFLCLFAFVLNSHSCTFKPEGLFISQWTECDSFQNLQTEHGANSPKHSDLILLCEIRLDPKNTTAEMKKKIHHCWSPA